MENQTDSNANTKDAATDTETTNSGTTPGQPLADVTGPKAAEDAAPHVPPEDVEAVFNERKNRNLLGDIFSGLRNKGGLSGVLNNFTMSMDSRNMLQVPCPHYIVFRMFDVITSWQKLSKELIHFSRWGLCGFLKRMWTEPYMLQLVEDLRVQASNDHRLYTDAPLIAKWNSPALQVQQSVYQYVCWRLNIDGGLDVGRHNLPHNQVQKLYWYHLLKTNKLQIHLYPEVSNALSQMTKKSSSNIKFTQNLT